MCISCGCWTDTSGKMGDDGAHMEDPTVMPKVKITVSPLAAKEKK